MMNSSWIAVSCHFRSTGYGVYVLFINVRAHHWMVMLVLLVALVAAEFWRTRDLRKIPLNSVFSTFEQKELQEISPSFMPQLDGGRIYEDSYGHDLDHLDSKFQLRQPDIFLVRGDTLDAAIKAASLRFLKGASADGAVEPKDDRVHQDLWITCYLGTAGSAPSAWQIQSIQIKGKVIRVRYSEPKRSWSTRDIRHYLAWAPLGRLPSGVYSVELVDATKGENVVERSVIVEEK